MTSITSSRSKLVSAEQAVEGSIYQGAYGIFPKNPPILILWRKDASAKVAYVYIRDIDTIVRLPYSYWIEESKALVDLEEYPEFDRRMKSKFQRDFPEQPIFWLNKPNIVSIPKKEVKTDKQETTNMAEVPATATKAPSKKEVRATYNAEIKVWKEQRETLSTANAELKKKVAATESREERKGFNDQIKANVEKRAALSDSIKANVEKVKALRAA